jgi:hypothetical protein
MLHEMLNGRLPCSALECELVQFAEQQAAENEALRQERDQLKAYCNRLRIAALNAISMMPGGNTKADLRDAYDETPEQCLAAHDAKVIERFLATQAPRIDPAWANPHRS